MDEGIAGASPRAFSMQQLVQLLSQAERRVARRLDRILESEGATVEEWRILVLLSDGVSHPMSEIAEFALLPPPSLTRVIDRMVADNLAYRKADPRDRRRVLIHITSRGRAVQRRLAARVEENQSAILAEAGADEVARLGALLTELADRLR